MCGSLLSKLSHPPALLVSPPHLRCLRRTLSRTDLVTTEAESGCWDEPQETASNEDMEEMVEWYEATPSDNSTAIKEVLGDSATTITGLESSTQDELEIDTQYLVSEDSMSWG
ncbi:uncharacterized protein LOC116614117 [Nematostella vectensis]|uniref:uncharacterized protein LOC116614117 n=1 Tax=Nematostella vectensis TaxID=45351 RepID=UPI00207714EA|nr:uncharacterized protein LOC116614117 [Nematostella vectensis]